jgi:hypothetical protein
MCDVGFSSLLQIKTKRRSGLSVEDDLRCTLSQLVRGQETRSRKTSAAFLLGEFLTSTLLHLQFLIRILLQN